MTRRIVALPIVGVALALIAFGVVRGVMDTGPARGTRMVITVDPPLDDAAMTIAEHAVRDRLSERGAPVRVVKNGDRLVVEVGEDDREILADMVAIVERVGILQVLSPEGTPILDPRAIRRVESSGDGVNVEVRTAAALDRVEPGKSVTFTFDGKPRLAVVPVRVDPTTLRVPVESDAFLLVNMLEAGAAHPMHVVKRDAFTRTTGFFPRAWPFFAAGVIALVIAALLWRRAAIPA